MRAAATIALLCALSRGGAAAPTLNRVESKRLKDLGAEALARADYATALDYFQRAYQAYPSANLRYDIAVAFARLGRSVEATQEFEDFLDAVPDAPPAARAFAEERLRELQPLVGRLQWTLAPPDARVALDGKPAATRTERGQPVAPGPHQLDAERAGYVAVHRSVDAVAGETTAIELTLRASPPPAVQSIPIVVTEPRRAKPIYKRWWLWTTIAGVIAAGVVTGVAIAYTTPRSAAWPPGTRTLTFP